MKAMSKQQLADAAGVSVTTLMNWCKAYRSELDALGMRLNMRVLPPHVGSDTNNKSTCGAITFTNTVSSLRSAAGTSANYTVGASLNGTSGKITVGGTERDQEFFKAGTGDAMKEFNYLP